MSTSAAQAAAFFSEALAGGHVFALEDQDGFPAPESASGECAMPFWSKQSRAEKVRSTVPAYGSFTVVALALAEWRERWLPGLAKDGVRVGLNWAGPRATGYDLLPDEVEARLDRRGRTTGRPVPGTVAALPTPSRASGPAAGLSPC